MLQLSFGGSDQETVERVQQKRERLIVEWVKTLDAQNIELQAHIVRDKLSGQVLHHRSGKLAGSIRVIKAKVEGGSITGGVEGAGGPAWYGVVHERGGTRAYEIKPVNKKALAFLPSGAGIGLPEARTVTRNLRVGKRGAVAAFNEAGGIVVKKVIHPPLPKRPFLATSLDERRTQIFDALQATTNRVLAE